MKMEQTECTETSEYEIQRPGNHPKEMKQHSERGESLKSRNNYVKNCVRHNEWWACSAVLRKASDVTWSQHTHRTPFWDVTQRMLAGVYRRFVTAYRFSPSRVKQSKTTWRLKSRGEQISYARSRPWLDLIQPRLILVGPQRGTCLMSPFWGLEFRDGS